MDILWLPHVISLGAIGLAELAIGGVTEWMVFYGRRVPPFALGFALLGISTFVLSGFAAKDQSVRVAFHWIRLGDTVPQREVRRAG